MKAVGCSSGQNSFLGDKTQGMMFRAGEEGIQEAVGRKEIRDG